jgi:hypothetical protein
MEGLSLHLITSSNRCQSTSNFDDSSDSLAMSFVHKISNLLSYFHLLAFGGRSQCEADLPSRLKLGRVQVSCEGYSHPDDPYILRGSCGLEYTLEATGNSYQQQQNSYGGDSSYNSYGLSVQWVSCSRPSDLNFDFSSGIFLHVIHAYPSQVAAMDIHPLDISRATPAILVTQGMAKLLLPSLVPLCSCWL